MNNNLILIVFNELLTTVLLTSSYTEGTGDSLEKLSSQYEILPLKRKCKNISTH